MASRAQAQSHAIASQGQTAIIADEQPMDVCSEPTVDPVLEKAQQLALEDLSGVFLFDAVAPLVDSLSLRVGTGWEQSKKTHIDHH